MADERSRDQLLEHVERIARWLESGVLLDDRGSAATLRQAAKLLLDDGPKVEAFEQPDGEYVVYIRLPGEEDWVSGIGPSPELAVLAAAAKLPTSDS